jgi:hypothetical protein
MKSLLAFVVLRVRGERGSTNKQDEGIIDKK